MKEEEFRKHVMPLRGRMYGLAIRLGLAPEDAADVVQDSLLKLWRLGRALPPDIQRLQGYCMATVRNNALSFLTSNASRLSNTDIKSVDVAAETDHSRYESKEEEARICRMIDSLPDMMGMAIRLSAFAELDNKEIATRMGTSEGNVRQLLSRGRKKLKELLGNGY